MIVSHDHMIASCHLIASSILKISLATASSYTPKVNLEATGQPKLQLSSRQPSCTFSGSKIQTPLSPPGENLEVLQCSASYHYATKITEIQYSTFFFQRVLYSNYVTPGDVINDDEMCAVNEISHIPHFPLLRVNLVLEILKSEIQSEIHRERSGNQANGLVSHMETT